jgi:transposase
MVANVYMVLRLPYYHPHIHPIELMWAEMKACVGTINKIYSIKDNEYYDEPILKGTTEDKWAGHCL